MSSILPGASLVAEIVDITGGGINCALNDGQARGGAAVLSACRAASSR
jgi:hypothetical protein